MLQFLEGFEINLISTLGTVIKLINKIFKENLNSFPSDTIIVKHFDFYYVRKVKTMFKFDLNFEELKFV